MKDKAEDILKGIEKGKIVNLTYKPKNAKEKLFCEMLAGCEMKKSDRYPESIFFVKGTKIYFEQDGKYHYFWCDDDLICTSFKSKFGMNYAATIAIIDGMVFKTLKLKGYTPLVSQPYNKPVVFKTLNLKGYTPVAVVE